MRTTVVYLRGVKRTRSYRRVRGVFNALVLTVLNSDTPPGIYRVAALLHQLVYYTLAHPGSASIQTQPPFSTGQTLGVRGNFTELRYNSALSGVFSSRSLDMSSAGHIFLDPLLRRDLWLALRCCSSLVWS